jgi:nitric oxide synthase oxygenase domain/subunit
MAMTQVVSENDGPEAAARSVTTTWSLLIPAISMLARATTRTILAAVCVRVRAHARLPG